LLKVRGRSAEEWNYKFFKADQPRTRRKIRTRKRALFVDALYGLLGNKSGGGFNAFSFAISNTTWSSSALMRLWRSTILCQSLFSMETSHRNSSDEVNSRFVSKPDMWLIVLLPVPEASKFMFCCMVVS